MFEVIHRGTKRQLKNTLFLEGLSLFASWGVNPGGSTQPYLIGAYIGSVTFGDTFTAHGGWIDAGLTGIVNSGFFPSYSLDKYTTDAVLVNNTTDDITIDGVYIRARNQEDIVQATLTNFLVAGAALITPLLLVPGGSLNVRFLISGAL